MFNAIKAFFARLTGSIESKYEKAKADLDREDALKQTEAKDPYVISEPIVAKVDETQIVGDEPLMVEEVEEPVVKKPARKAPAKKPVAKSKVTPAKPAAKKPVAPAKKAPAKRNVKK